MVMKKNRGVQVVTEAGAHAVLRRAAARELTPEEDRVMRMRLGAAPPRAVPLEQSFDGPSDLEIEIRAAEIEAWMKWKARAAVRTEPRPGPRPSRTKEKIIRALRRKG